MADISSITLPDGTTYNIKDATARKGQSVYYATCTTAAGTAAKVATTTNGDFVLETGAMVRVKFTNADTYNGTSTLNVDSKGAKNIVRVGTTIKPRYNWTAGEVVDFVYDGTYFVMSDAGTATTSYYGITALSSATNSTSEVLAATPKAVKEAYDLAASKGSGTVTSIATGTGLTGGPITSSGTISLESGVVTAGSAGPTAAVTGSEGTTVAIPRITVDEYGRVTGLTSYNLTNKNTTYTAATSAPGNVASSSAVGTSTNYARQDHTHGITLATGDANGQVKIAGTNVDVKGWNTAATYDVETSVADDSKLPTGAAVKSFVEGKGYITTDNDHFPSAHCVTSGPTAAKLAVCTNYTLTANTYLHFNILYANTVQGAITMNVNSKGAKPIYINGTASSASNYTLPAGTYIAFYNGTNWDFRTDGKLPADISGDAATVNGHTVGADVPSNAVFTDTTALTSMTGTLAIDHGGTGATSASVARTNLGLGSAATYDVESTVANDSKLPTGAAVYNHTANRTFFGTCSTAAATSEKVITLVDADDFKLVPGVMIAVKYTISNTASNCTLNVNGTGGKQVWWATAAYTGSSKELLGYANRFVYYVYDGTYWAFVNHSGNGNDNVNTVPSAQCETAAATAAKAATCTNYTLTANTYLHFNIRYANTVAGAITMNVNSKGAKPIYINGTASSASNYSLPAGTYIAFYNGTYWDFRTDGMLPCTPSLTRIASLSTSGTSSMTITFTGTCRGLLVGLSSSAARSFMYMLACNASTNGVVDVVPAGSSITVDQSVAGKITITTNSSGMCAVFLLAFEGAQNYTIT